MNILGYIVQYAEAFISVITVILGITILAHDKKNKANMAFFVMTIGFFLWIFSNTMIDSSRTLASALFWGNCSIIGPLFIPPALCYFVSIFPKKNLETEGRDSLFLYLMIILAVISILLVPTDYNMQAVHISKSGYYMFDVGLIYYVGIVQQSLSLIFSTIIVLTKRKILDDTERKQLRNVFLGLLITIFFGTVFNGIILLFPAAEKIPPGIGPICTFFILYFSVRAIIRYNSFDIKITPTKFFIFLILILLFSQIIFANTTANLLFTMVIFLSVSVFSYFLLESIIRQEKQKKKIEVLLDEIKEKNLELNRLNNIKNNFIQVAVHEINTPAASINGYLSLILDEGIGEIDERARRYLDIVYINARRLTTLVADFLNVNKIESGKIELRPREINLVDLVKAVSLDNHKAISTKNNKLIFGKNIKNLNEAKLFIDEDKIKEVLINLIVNANKFTDNGEISIDIKNDGDYFVISVKDNGLGISKENLEKIFNRFFQESNNMTRDSGGMGLGLYISKKIIELHEGKIIVKSKEGEGSEFLVYLPIKNSNLQNKNCLLE